jgi:kynurenine formamidase
MDGDAKPLPGNWGRWGEADERGAANYLTPERLVQATRLVRTGKVYPLGLPVQSTGVPVFPRRSAPQHFMTLDGGDFAAGLKRSGGFQSSDDYLALFTHGTTHVDALAHVWYGDQLFNGFSGNTVRSSGAKHLGVEKLGHLVGRGVLLDMCRFRGETPVPPGTELMPDDFEACAKAQGVELREGDILLVRTGWLGAYDEKNPSRSFAGEAGPGLAAGEWIGARGFAAIGMDNFAVEVAPTHDRTMAPVHKRLIRDYGVYLMEFMVLDQLAAEEAWEFLFVAAPLRITGGSASPINPLAIC